LAAPVTWQVSGGTALALAPASTGPENGQPLEAAVAELPVLDASGKRVPFGALFRERRALAVFVGRFLRYICKEYVEDLAKISKSFLQSPHVKSDLLSGGLRSLWRAVTGLLFDFQGDPAQQGGTLILGPGNNIHFIHSNRNSLDNKSINPVLQLTAFSR
jgi:hypothetical protein